MNTPWPGGAIGTLNKFSYNAGIFLIHRGFAATA
jgi:hypothetical protein